MGQGVSEILTFAVGVAISPVPIIAVILMLFSPGARVNGPAFLVGWVVALGAVGAAAYALSDAGDASTSSTASDTISWGKIALGVVLLLFAARTWRRRPGPGEEAPAPKWMSGIDGLTAGKALMSKPYHETSFGSTPSSAFGQHARAPRWGASERLDAGRRSSTDPLDSYRLVIR